MLPTLSLVRPIVAVTMMAAPAAARQEAPAAPPKSSMAATSRDLGGHDRSEAPAEAPRSEWTPIPVGDPGKAEVTFPAGAGWQGTLVIDNDGVGIWTVAVMQAIRSYACPEIIGLDDLGQCHLLWGYSGKWKPITTVSDGSWLGGLAQADIDPRVPGPEIYVGSQKGNIYEVVAYPDRLADNRRVARLDGHEIHTLIGGELDPFSDGPELLAFTRPGALYRLKPKPPEQDGFDAQHLLELEGRVRQAVLLPRAAEGPAEIAVVMRTGRVALMKFTSDGPKFETIHELPMGMGRLALAHFSTVEQPVLYSTVDDGRVYRHERDQGRVWRSELIYAGPQGMRGCASGRFDADAGVETLAVFGYGHRVELLSLRGDRWERETLFVDSDKGHWLAAGELDGRNATDELVSTGYSGRVVMLARPPGYGLDVLATDPIGPKDEGGVE